MRGFCGGLYYYSTNCQFQREAQAQGWPFVVFVIGLVAVILLVVWALNRK